MATKKKKISFLKVILILGLLGGLGYLAYWFFVIRRRGSAPSEAITEKIIFQTTNENKPNQNPGSGSQKPPGNDEFPLKEGSRGELVKYAQIMLNKVPNTGGRISEDGNWGPKTQSKFVAAVPFFFGIGQKRTELSKIEYMKMYCRTWPNSGGCAKFKAQYPQIVFTVGA